jgi:hypothetical protein
MTTQLKSELDVKRLFEDFCRKKGWDITKVYRSDENKKENVDYDYLINMEGLGTSISLKSDKGVFTQKNLGTGIQAVKKWNYDEDELRLIKEAAKKSREIKSSYKEARWDEMPNELHAKRKQEVMEPFISAWEKILANPFSQFLFFEYLNGGKAQFLYTPRGGLEKTSSVCGGSCVQRVNSKSLRVGDLVLRFKSEGGKVKSSIKINVEKAKD